MITQYRPGDADDFDRLYRDSYPRILRTLIGVLGDRAAAARRSSLVNRS